MIVRYANSKHTVIFVEEGDDGEFEAGMSIPCASSNRHFIAVMEWLDAGNEIAPYVPPQLTVDQQRQQAYLDAGITPDVMMEALWEKLVERRPEKANQLQAKRADVKARFPKNGG